MNLRRILNPSTRRNLTSLKNGFCHFSRPRVREAAATSRVRLTGIAVIVRRWLIKLAR